MKRRSHEFSYVFSSSLMGWMVYPVFLRVLLILCVFADVDFVASVVCEACAGDWLAVNFHSCFPFYLYMIFLMVWFYIKTLV